MEMFVEKVLIIVIKKSIDLYKYLEVQIIKIVEYQEKVINLLSLGSHFSNSGGNFFVRERLKLES